MFSWSPSSDLNEPAPMVEDADGDDMATEDQNIITPYTVTVASGYQLLRDPHHNKGLAFTENEREAHFLRGLLPPAVLSQELQVKEMVKIICSHRAPWQMYKGMMELKERNERLFYKLLITNLEELIPVFDTPSIGKACQTFRSISRQPHGLFISLKEKGRIREVLRNWPEKKIQIIVVTDGEQISSIGDLGCQGMGVAVGKVLLYSALGGVRPSACLPVIIDVGTNNKKLRRDQFYFGLKRKRVTGQRYTELLDEFMTAVKQNYGETVLIQFQGFAHDNALRLLAKYGATHLVFNDDIQLKPSVVLAAIIATLKCIQRTSTDHRILFSGSGEAATDIAQLIALKISKQMDIPMEVARENIFLMDSKGLIAKSRVPSLEPSMRMWANGFKPVQTLLNAVKVIKPRYLIGSSGEGKAFTKEVIEAMSRFEKAHIPFIFTLSNITAQSECTAEEAYNWSLGQVYFASGSPFAPVKYDDFIYKPSQINNAYIFPGFGLGLIISGATRFHEDMLLAASEALSEQVSESNLNEGLVYPPFSDMRKISPYIAARVAAKAYELGLATRLPQPENLVGVAERSMYSPNYCNYR